MVCFISCAFFHNKKKTRTPLYGLSLKSTVTTSPRYQKWIPTESCEGKWKQHQFQVKCLCGSFQVAKNLWPLILSFILMGRTQLSDFTFTFHFHALEKEMATHSSVLAWRIPGTGEPGGLPSMGSHRVRHDWSDLAVAAAVSWANRASQTWVN